MTDQTHSGRCYCGEVRYRVSGDIRSLCYCHCESCRRASGAPFVAWGTVDPQHFDVTRGRLTVVRLTPGVERGFCDACGSSITYAHEHRPQDLDFTLATLDAPSLLQPTRHIWTQDKLPWVQIDDGLPQYLTVSGA